MSANFNAENDFKVYNFSDLILTVSICDLLVKGFTFVPDQSINLVHTLIDLKQYIRKLNLNIIFNKLEQIGDPFKISSTYNPPLHTTLATFERVCEPDLHEPSKTRNKRKANNRIHRNPNCDEESEPDPLTYNKEVRTMKPDKGGRVVTMNKVDHNNKMPETLDTGTYTKMLLE